MHIQNCLSIHIFTHFLTVACKKFSWDIISYEKQKEGKTFYQVKENFHFYRMRNVRSHNIVIFNWNKSLHLKYVFSAKVILL